MRRKYSCNVARVMRCIGQQFVHAQTGLSGDSFQQLRRCRVNPVLKVCNRRLAHPDTFGKRLLCRAGPVAPMLESFHGGEDIGLPYSYAIGGSYEPASQNWPMPRHKERSFLDRALEALKDRYPRERPTQIRLAKIAGVSQPAVFEWGLPGRAPEHKTVLNLAYELNVCVEWLYTERGPKHPQKAEDSADPFLQKWNELPPEIRQQVSRYTDFVKGEPPPKQ